MSQCDPFNFILFILCFFALGIGFWLGVKVSALTKTGEQK